MFFRNEMEKMCQELFNLTNFLIRFFQKTTQRDVIFSDLSKTLRRSLQKLCKCIKKAILSDSFQNISSVIISLLQAQHRRSTMRLAELHLLHLFLRSPLQAESIK